MPVRRDLVAQLRKGLTDLNLDNHVKEGAVRLVFPWTVALVLPLPLSNQTGLSQVLYRRKRSDILGRCPIFRALSPANQVELLLRGGPKGLLRYHSSVWGFLVTALEAYMTFTPGGVSPITAMALLLPEPRQELRHAAIAPVTVVPEPIRQRTEEWQVLVWALKRYLDLSWKDIASLGPDLRRGPTSFRQTVRRNVEEPLAVFYHQLTGKALDPQSYTCALSDRPDSPSWSKERLRDLKRAARAKGGNPTK